MIRYLIPLIAFFTLSALTCFYRETADDNRLRAIIREKGQVEVMIAAPARAEIDRITRHVSISSAKNDRIYIILSPLTVEWFISQGYNYSIVYRDEGKAVVTASNTDEAKQWDVYPTFTQYESIMRSFAGEFPDLCSLDTIGTSIQGRSLLALRISGNGSPGSHRPKVFYSASIHGNETAGFVLMMRLSEYLLSNYSADSYVKNLVDNLEIWINPLANPDGMYRNGDEIINPVRDNLNGYDLNRNFPDPGVSDNVLQKETIEMMRFLSKKRFTLSANFHSGEELINYPWDHLSREHADFSWFYSISRGYADTAHLYSRKGYMSAFYDGVTNGYAWYPVYGGRQDYVVWYLNGREVTVELDSNYISPATDLPLLWEYNRRSFLGYIENALYGIHGSVNDSKTGKPVPAKITIANHDMDNSEVYSDSLDGSFVRLIDQGSWDLAFTAGGYNDTLIQNVTVVNREPTVLNVVMRAIDKRADTLRNTDILLYPNPARKNIKAVIDEKLRGQVNVSIYGIDGRQIWGFDIYSPDLSPIDIDISRLDAGTYIMVIKNKTTGDTGKAKFSVAGGN